MLTPPLRGASPPLALELRGIVKHYGTLLALDNVDFSLRPGEIHALLGENGAGKSTLMQIVRGLTLPNAGQIWRDGQPVVFRSAGEAARAGIGMVHQHFLLVPRFSVLENLALSVASPPKNLWLDTNALRAQAEAIARRLGWSLPLDTRVAALPVGTQQRVEILRALMSDARVLLLDEPTAVLAPTEVEELFQVLRALRDEGRALVFVSHKLSETLALCDRVSVLRRGRMVGTVAAADTDPSDLARRMVGEGEKEGPSGPLPPSPVLTGEGRHSYGGVRARAAAGSANPAPVVAVAGLCTAAQAGAVALSNLTFDVQAGEIFGVAGVDGNGQRELAEALTGQRPWIGGSVALRGSVIASLKPSERAAQGIALVPPDRRAEGLALTLSVADNLCLEAARERQFQQGPLLNARSLAQWAADCAARFDVRVAALDTPASALSGGNQQKIVLARALASAPTLLVACSPTRGLDVAATAYVHARLREMAARGGAILLVSTELEEVLALSNRVGVLYEGRFVGIVSPQTPREMLGLMLGGQGG